MDVQQELNTLTMVIAEQAKENVFLKTQIRQLKSEKQAMAGQMEEMKAKLLMFEEPG